MHARANHRHHAFRPSDSRGLAGRARWGYHTASALNQMPVLFKTVPLIVAGALAAVVASEPAAQRPAGAKLELPFVDARAVIDALPADLPPEFTGKSLVDIERIWPAWVTRHNLEIRARLDPWRRGFRRQLLALRNLVHGVAGGGGAHWFKPGRSIGSQRCPPPADRRSDGGCCFAAR